MHKPGGVAEHVEHLREEFRRLGHTVKVMAPRGPKGGLEVSNDHYGIGRAITIPGNGSKVRLTFDVTLYAEVRQIMQREQFDVVHYHEPLQPVLPSMVMLNSRAVNVATFHAYAERQPLYDIFRPYMSYLLSMVDGRIAVSEPARELVSRYFPGDYRIIPNGVDVDAYGPHVRPFPWAQDGTKRILFVGRFDEPRKGFRILLRAMPLVRMAFPGARLLVIGAGRPEKFAGLIDRLGLTGIDYHGYVSFADKTRYYASCNVACVPSTSGESFGYTVVEPMAAGKPVVASNIAGYASVLTNGQNGLLVQPRNHEALAMALVRVLADQDLAAGLGVRGHQDAQQYSWSRVTAQVLDEYAAAAERARLRHATR